jgi:hypothetical protein
LELQAIRGTIVEPENVAAVGAPAEQLLVPSTTLRRKILGAASWVIQRQLGAIGSMTAV